MRRRRKSGIGMTEKSDVDFILRSKVLANQVSRGICQAHIPGHSGAEVTHSAHLQPVWVVRASVPETEADPLCPIGKQTAACERDICINHSEELERGEGNGKASAGWLSLVS